jgi:hypothetical protein
MKSPVLVIIAMSCCLVTAASAVGVKPPALPSDAELKKWIVGTWRIDYPSSPTRSVYGYEIYRDDGTFRHFNEVKEGSAAPKLLTSVSGTWNVEDGYVLMTVRAASLSFTSGPPHRHQIESANPDWFTLRENGNLRTLRRAQLPAEVVSGAADVPRVFTVKEAAQALRYAVKPKYSPEARRERDTGGGLFELRFDYETGRLKAIDIVASTGSQILDHDTIDALKEWKAKPHTVRVMRIGITFKHG